MSDQPLVSIIIPTYNRAHLIGETLDSVLAQTYQNWECIVVDDGSTDDTDKVMAQYCEKDSRFQYHHRPQDRLPGGNAARNYGFEISKGEFVNWFDSDDVMMPYKLELKLKLLISSTFDFVVCKGALYDSLPTIEPMPWPLHLEGNVLFNHICGRIAFGTNGPLFRREFLLKYLMLFDERLLIRQDWEFFNRLLISRPSVKIIIRPLYLFRNLKSGIRGKKDTSKIKSMIKAEQLTFLNLKHANYLNTSEETYKYRKIMIRRCATFYNGFPLIDKFGQLYFTLSTILMAVDVNFAKLYLKEKYNSY